MCHSDERPEAFQLARFRIDTSHMGSRRPRDCRITDERRAGIFDLAAETRVWCRVRGVWSWQVMSRIFYTSPLMQESRRGSNVRVVFASRKADDGSSEHPASRGRSTRARRTEFLAGECEETRGARSTGRGFNRAGGVCVEAPAWGSLARLPFSDEEAATFFTDALPLAPHRSPPPRRWASSDSMAPCREHRSMPCGGQRLQLRLRRAWARAQFDFAPSPPLAVATR